MSVENFLVRPQRRLVEKYSAGQRLGRALGSMSRHELTHELAGLPTSATDDDLAAKQFDILILQAQLSVLRVDAAFVGPAEGQIVQDRRTAGEERNCLTCRWWPVSSPSFTKSKATTIGRMSPRRCWRPCAAASVP